MTEDMASDGARPNTSPAGSVQDREALADRLDAWAVDLDAGMRSTDNRAVPIMIERAELLRAAATALRTPAVAREPDGEWAREYERLFGLYNAARDDWENACGCNNVNGDCDWCAMFPNALAEAEVVKDAARDALDAHVLGTPAAPEPEPPARTLATVLREWDADTRAAAPEPDAVALLDEIARAVRATPKGREADGMENVASILARLRTTHSTQDGES